MGPLFSTPAAPRLDVGAALQEGWRAFCRSPWAFVGFSLLVSLVGLVGQTIQNLGSAEGATLPQQLLALLATLGVLVLNLWGIQGLIRGAWLALEGRRPAFSDFTRWNGAGMLRLFLVSLVVALGLVTLALGLGFLSGGLGTLNRVLGLLPLVAGLAALLWLIITQHFLAPITLIQGSGPLDTLRRGQEMVQPRMGQVLLLILLEAAITLAGVAALLVGVFVAWPVATCVATAAYRQLFGTSVKTDLLAGSNGGSVLL